MTLRDAVAFLADKVPELEPGEPCFICVVPVFPRIRYWSTPGNGPAWRPGLVWSEGDRAWYQAAKLASLNGQPMPCLPDGPVYVPCSTCGGSGVVNQGGPWHNVLTVFQAAAQELETRTRESGRSRR